MQGAINPSLDGESSMNEEPLIPGLPDDVALKCLLRLPVDQKACKVVCKRWLSLFGSKRRYYTTRKEFGFHDPFLFVCSFDRVTTEVDWKVLDLAHFSWHDISAMPFMDKVPHGFRCVSIPHKGVLFVCGGAVSELDRPRNLVLKYEVEKDRWSVMNNSMISARSFFACGVIDGKIYAAGGKGLNLLELNTAEVLDPNQGTWRSIASFEINMASGDTAVLNEKLLVTEGWFWPFYNVPKGQAYDPRTDKWEIMASGLREGWTGPSATVHGHLFVITEHERTKLKVYDAETDSWEVVKGPSLPEQIIKPFSVNGCDCRIIVVGQNLHVAVGKIMKLCPETSTTTTKCDFSVEWQLVDAPDSSSNMTPLSAHVVFA